ncbi:MAG: hypothetical protein WDM77_03825 [Steroidobacteraceae bacterium]
MGARGLTQVLNAVRAEGKELAPGLKFALAAVDESLSGLSAALPSRAGRIPWEECPPALDRADLGSGASHGGTGR